MTTERQKEKLRQEEWDAYRAVQKSASDDYDAVVKPARDKRDKRLREIEEME